VPVALVLTVAVVASLCGAALDPRTSPALWIVSSDGAHASAVQQLDQSPVVALAYALPPSTHVGAALSVDPNASCLTLYLLSLDATDANKTHVGAIESLTGDAWHRPYRSFGHSIESGKLYWYEALARWLAGSLARSLADWFTGCGAGFASRARRSTRSSSRWHLMVVRAR